MAIRWKDRLESAALPLGMAATLVIIELLWKWIHSAYKKPLKLYVLPPLAMAFCFSSIVTGLFMAVFKQPDLNVFAQITLALQTMGIIFGPVFLLGFVFQVLVGLPAEEYLRHKSADISQYLSTGWLLAIIPSVGLLATQMYSGNFANSPMSFIPVTWLFTNPEFTQLATLIIVFFGSHGSFQGAVTYYLSRKSKP